MRRFETSLPSGRTLLGIDIALIVWSVAWVAIGIAVSREVNGLAELSDTVRRVGTAVEASGGVLGTLGGLPLIGDAFGDTLTGPAQDIQEAGQSAQASGQASRGSIDALSTLLGLAVALIPSVPLVALYLPARVSRAREARALGAAVRLSGDDPDFREFLAHRAVHNLTYRRLAGVAPEPWRELSEGRFDGLARAELERLGVDPGRHGPRLR
jgi:hypothetical protein